MRQAKDNCLQPLLLTVALLLLAGGCASPKPAAPEAGVQVQPEVPAAVDAGPEQAAKPAPSANAGQEAVAGQATAAPAVPKPARQPAPEVSGAAGNEVQAHANFAVLTARPAADPGLLGLKKKFLTAMAFGPRQIFILGNPAAVAPLLGEFRQAAGKDVRVVALPAAGAGQPELASWPCGSFGRIFFIPAALAGNLRELTAALAAAALPPGFKGTAVVLLERPHWEVPADIEAWKAVRGVFSRLGAAHTVFAAAGSPKFSWEQGADATYLKLGWGAEADNDGFADGFVKSFLWCSLLSSGPQLHVPGEEPLLPARTFSVANQTERQSLRRALTATPASNLLPQTTVSMANTSAQTMDFRAAWFFAEDGVKVDPEILGFRLEPGRVFRQTFRFIYDGNRQLRLLQPRLQLSTVHAGPDNTRAPLLLTVSPWIRQSGFMQQPAAAPKVDGRLEEWPQPGLGINHRSQVVMGLDNWQGPGDLYGTLHGAVVDGDLYLALLVKCGRPGFADSASGDARAMAEILVDLRDSGGENEVAAEFAAGELVRMSLPAGGVPLAGGTDGAQLVEMAAAPAADGLAFEARIPASLFAGGRLPGRLVLLDARIAAAGMQMQLSGESAAPRTNQRFAILAVP